VCVRAPGGDDDRAATVGRCSKRRRGAGIGACLDERECALAGPSEREASVRDA
jgi:hypothetical protein